MKFSGAGLTVIILVGFYAHSQVMREHSTMRPGTIRTGPIFGSPGTFIGSGALGSFTWNSPFSTSIESFGEPYMRSAERLYGQGRLVETRRDLVEALTWGATGHGWLESKNWLRGLDQRILNSATEHIQSHEWATAHDELRILLIGQAQRRVREEALQLIQLTDDPVFFSAQEAFAAENWKVAADGFAAIRFGKYSSVHKAEAGRLLAASLLNWTKQLQKEGLWQFAAYALNSFGNISEARRAERREAHRLRVSSYQRWGEEAYRQHDWRRALDAFTELRFISELKGEEDSQAVNLAETNVKRIRQESHSQGDNGETGAFDKDASFFVSLDVAVRDGDALETREILYQYLQERGHSKARVAQVRSWVRHLDKHILSIAEQHMESGDWFKAQRELRTVLEGHTDSVVRKIAFQLIQRTGEHLLNEANNAFDRRSWEVAAEEFSEIWLAPHDSANHHLISKRLANSLANVIEDLYREAQRNATRDPLFKILKTADERIALNGAVSNIALLCSISEVGSHDRRRVQMLLEHWQNETNDSENSSFIAEALRDLTDPSQRGHTPLLPFAFYVYHVQVYRPGSIYKKGPVDQMIDTLSNNIPPGLMAPFDTIVHAHGDWLM